ncbi:DNA recombination protein RmuC [Demequina sp. TTPB684]|uniref:DNA recombination protein RmuC n=1 Tax=unclassified Demequina TaxID=2620311 RepID=UPI001CF187FF|nr:MULTISPECIES: DNA recombination protein RmuC [unclassified Demequina]MCB2411617.1 DNA recombination protein RmuC [Demequina sp. TTPB684]UPU87337.1 DNA recombination protein RmuC [Demequina sp. TMPB413]
MEYLIAVVAGIAGIAIGYLLGALRTASATRDADARVAEARSALDVERARAVDFERRIVETAEAAARREAALTEAHDKYVLQIRGDQETLRREFQALSAETLKASQEQLLAVAQERLSRERQAADAELAKREQSVKTMVEPIAKALLEVQRQTTETDRSRAEGQAALAQQVRQMLDASEKLDKKTSDFINTLRRSDVRGNWGEVQLRRVVELSGMVNHVDFEEQENVKDAEGKNLRPDMTVKLAGGRTIVVDSKVALSALLEAFETDDEVVRAERLLAHARHVKKHVDDLASKKYWDMFDSAPEFVVMFVPSEAFYQSALEQDRGLQEYAFAKRVVIATPTTLVAMLRTVAHAWKEDTLAKNAQQVLATGKELYDRLITMGGHLARVGKALEGAGKAYNATVASMESRVLVSARKFGEMQEISGAIEESNPVHLDIRQIASPEFDAGDEPTT